MIGENSGALIPLELFLPMPSLSTTSSLHLMRLDEEVASGASSARNRRVVGIATDGSCASVAVC